MKTKDVLITLLILIIWLYIFQSINLITRQENMIRDLRSSQDSWYQEQVEKWIPPEIQTKPMDGKSHFKIKTPKFEKGLDKDFKVIYIPYQD